MYALQYINDAGVGVGFVGNARPRVDGPEGARKFATHADAACDLAARPELWAAAALCGGPAVRVAEIAWPPAEAPAPAPARPGKARRYARR